jgi:hypothetical protein
MSPELKAKLVKILKGAFIAGIGAALAYAVKAAMNDKDFAIYAPLIGAAAAVLVNAVRKMMPDADQIDPPPDRPTGGKQSPPFQIP